jgi:uncharacterized OB-fold protein/acyl dehydratase
MADQPDPFYAELKSFEGATVGEPARARDPVNLAMIRHWCDAVDDRNPVYTDPEFAAGSIHGGIVAPPAMLQAWTMRGLRPPGGASSAPGAQAQLLALLDGAGFTSVVATDCSQEYRRYLRPGDELTVETTIESVSPEKRTALGAGHFVTQRMVYRDQRGEEVATMRFRILKFRPGSGRDAGRSAAAGRPAARRKRPRPAVTHDNAFFWEGIARGQLLLQRCKCGRFRHPPGPVCPSCRSFDWEPVAAGGRGRVYSFVVAHHPAIPPFEYPNPIALVELEEGPRLVANLVGVAPEAIRIGMPVECEIVEVEEGFRLPRFRPARPAEGA